MIAFKCDETKDGEERGLKQSKTLPELNLRTDLI
jgi:hypothetical protein